MTLIAAGARHSLARGVVEDHPVFCLESHDEDLRVTIAPGLGSVVCSLRHRLPFALAGGGRRIEVVLETGYPFAQVFAPCDDEVLCFEPMTAPANALRVEPPSVAPGETYRAQFSITVSPW